ncbi:serine O-acetyltransferase [Taibaiella koreensis]|uniref:serine O-acetyltransferase n=1 Tax=Taibaiella koreensis TaxID=1268548 RepID=UPI000E5A047B|nr:serine O-acetyltransferase [Taibaiella koreensis]
MSSLRQLIGADLKRYRGRASFKDGVIAYLRVSGFRFMFWHRIAHRCRSNKALYLFPWLVLSRLKYKYGYDIPAETHIEPGFYIGHFGGIVVSPLAKIGRNCNISQGVTIGFNPRGKRQGYPVLGNEVYIAPGAKIIGRVTIGNNVAIGANAVVLDDLPDNSVAAGNPARVVSTNGAAGYIINKAD